MKVLFIGGSGNISSYCTNEALSKGHEIYHFNRGMSNKVDFQEKVFSIEGDINSKEDRKKLNSFAPFDVVANFIAFVPEQIQADIDYFYEKCSQYIFISSATVYQKPPENYIVTEDAKLNNPFWEYARNKIACERLLAG